MRPYTDRQAAFSLIEVVVAICVTLILAGMLIPLAGKAINQQREIKTRESLKTAFEGMFGARDRRVANMRADFGFEPTANLADLSAMVLSANAGTTLPQFGYNTANLLWGWNGPYWQGSIDSNTTTTSRPLDAWGRPMRLVVTTVSAINYYQVQSSGADRTFGTTDDLVYPAVPAAEVSYNATLIIVVNKNSGSTSYTGNCSLIYLNGTNTPTNNIPGTSPNIANNPNPQVFSWNVAAGGMKVTLAPTTGTFTTVYLSLDLLPGETRQIDLYI